MKRKLQKIILSMIILLFTFTTTVNANNEEDVTMENLIESQTEELRNIEFYRRGK